MKLFNVIYTYTGIDISGVNLFRRLGISETQTELDEALALYEQRHAGEPGLAKTVSDYRAILQIEKMRPDLIEYYRTMEQPDLAAANRFFAYASAVGQLDRETVNAYYQHYGIAETEKIEALLEGFYDFPQTGKGGKRREAYRAIAFVQLCQGYFEELNQEISATNDMVLYQALAGLNEAVYTMGDSAFLNFLEEQKTVVSSPLFRGLCEKMTDYFASHPDFDLATLRLLLDFSELNLYAWISGEITRQEVALLQERAVSFGYYTDQDSQRFETEYFQPAQRFFGIRVVEKRQEPAVPVQTPAAVPTPAPAEVQTPAPAEAKTPILESVPFDQLPVKSSVKPGFSAFVIAFFAYWPFLLLQGAHRLVKFILDHPLGYSIVTSLLIGVPALVRTLISDSFDKAIYCIGIVAGVVVYGLFAYFMCDAMDAYFNWNSYKCFVMLKDHIYTGIKEDLKTGGFWYAVRRKLSYIFVNILVPTLLVVGIILLATL